MSDVLPLMESFYTIQGEGYYQGSAAYFLRLGGCDVGCHWCDVKDSWDAEAHPKVSIPAMTEEVTQSGSRIAVITGGEPLMHDLTSLTKALQNEGVRTHIETSAVYPLTGTWDWVCVSPKKFKPAKEEVLAVCDELKIIVFHPNDLDWAEGFITKVKPECKLFLQPEWSRQEEMLPLIISYIKENPKWTISLQIHKYMNIP
ncbi:MAG: 7-carboxy-7-deazaguanine synthase QueE [Cytophagaceae bacterium]|nr:7-carboxy-7-deazaguanine synthase QueE [Cytophagaceae bacterium]